MQTNPYHIITPSIFRSPVKFFPPRRIRFHPTQVTPISTCNGDGKSTAFWDYQSLFVSQRLEVANPIKLRLVDGALPKDFPSGTYYLIGPGLFEDDFGSVVHPLDGHGYIRAFEIDGPKGEVEFLAKYVKTKAQIEECDPISGLWRFSYRGPFSVLKGGKKFPNTKVMKNVANTSILKWGGRLFCLWEGGTPYEIHSRTLDTVGTLDFINDHDHGGETRVDVWPWDVVAHLLKPILYGIFKMPGKRILSHYKIDVRRERLIIMACNAEDILLPRSHFTFYEFDMKFNLLQRREFDIPDHLMIHDWAFTDTHYILFGNRVKFDVPGSIAAISGLVPMISAVSVNHSKPTSPVYLLPRFSEANLNNWQKPIEAPQVWLLHVANAFEEVDEDDGSLKIQIHASVCAYKWFNFQNMFGYNWESHVLDPSTMNGGGGKEQLLPHLVKVYIRLHKDEKHYRSSCSVTSLEEGCKSRCSDFAVINPLYSSHKHRYVYAAASSGSYESLPDFPFDTIVKWDTVNETRRVWSTGNRTFIGEPMFVSRGSGKGAEDDGFLLAVEYVVAHRRCNLVILDAREVGEGKTVVARFEVPGYLTFPLGFHGTWTPKE